MEEILKSDKTDISGKKIAIYTRKSKYSDKSESIDSQIEYCKLSAKARYPHIDDYIIYVDEGFSGGSADRPQYRKLLSDIKSGLFTALICYKIDRISRSLADFTELQKHLDKHGINIISASEGFDTATPWGQAVLNILMIFAQLERGNVSERVKDTMLHYARQGRWTGGTTPTGFISESVTYEDALGNQKRKVVLSPLEDEAKTVKLIFMKYIEIKSLSGLERYLCKENIKTKNGGLFSAASISDILKNPVYAAADKHLYKYFRERDAEICNSEQEFNGEYAVLPYNREDKKKLSSKPVSEWIIAISRHKGIIDGKEWVKVQEILKKNGERKPRLGTADYGIFSGLITCAKCGSTMRVKKGRLHKDQLQFYYVCRLKESGSIKKCDMKNIQGHTAEPLIIKHLEKHAAHLPWVRIKETDITEELGRLERTKEKIFQKEQAISNLVLQASQASEARAGKYIIDAINELDKEITELKQSRKFEKDGDSEHLMKVLSGISGGFDEIGSVKAKRSLINLLVNNIVWDGKTLIITFNDYGGMSQH